MGIRQGLLRSCGDKDIVHPVAFRQGRAVLLVLIFWAWKLHMLVFDDENIAAGRPATVVGPEEAVQDHTRDIPGPCDMVGQLSFLLTPLLPWKLICSFENLHACKKALTSPHGCTGSPAARSTPRHRD